MRTMTIASAFPLINAIFASQNFALAAANHILHHISTNWTAGMIRFRSPKFNAAGMVDGIDSQYIKTKVVKFGVWDTLAIFVVQHGKKRNLYITMEYVKGN